MRIHKQSLGERLDYYQGLGPGFDFLRIFLACAIVVVHAYWLTGDNFIRNSPLWFAEYAFVPMFFALSGFLITGSALRLNLGNFLMNRSLRIIPALVMDVIICALIIGPLFTKLSLNEYFTRDETYKYFLNSVGWMHYRLPGVFEDHITYQVNGSLWTVPYEILCYGIMSGLIITGALRSGRMVLLSAVIFMAVGLSFELLRNIAPAELFRFVRFFMISRGGQSITAFLMGIVVYLYRYRIPYSTGLLLGSVIVCLISTLALSGSDIERVGNRFIVLPSLVYMTIFLGLTPIPVPQFAKAGDYSYGIYLYHAPLLQVFIGLIPSVVLAPVYGPVLLVIIVIPAVALLAAFSWHVVEKPILAQRKRFSFVSRVRGVASSTEPTVGPSVGGTIDPSDFMGTSKKA